MSEPTAPVVTWSRHRLRTDGEGVTTLVIVHGCPLRCRYCLNPYTTDPATRLRSMTPQDLFDAVKADALYFEATGGGVTFGGGEPLLYPAFLTAFRALTPRWRMLIETSLHVPWEAVETAAGVADGFLVDIKALDPAVYRRYTGQDNALVLDNLSRLLRLVGPDRVTVRVPQIPSFNTASDVATSLSALRAMGVTQLDPFTYTVRS